MPSTEQKNTYLFFFVCFLTCSICRPRCWWSLWQISPGEWNTSAARTSSTETLLLATACKPELCPHALLVFPVCHRLLSLCAVADVFQRTKRREFVQSRLTWSSHDILYCSWLTTTETKSLWRFSLLQAEWEHECVCGWLWPLQEDLQWRLLQTGEDLQDACEVDRYWKLGWSCLHHQKWCGEFSDPVLLLYSDFFSFIVYWLGLRLMFKVKFCFQLRYPTVLISVTADTTIKTLV